MNLPRPKPTDNPIRRRRLELGWSQIRAAAELGFSGSYYSAIEREPRAASELFRRRLCEVFGLDMAEVRP